MQRKYLPAYKRIAILSSFDLEWLAKINSHKVFVEFLPPSTLERFFIKDSAYNLIQKPDIEVESKSFTRFSDIINNFIGKKDAKDTCLASIYDDFNGKKEINNILLASMFNFFRYNLQYYICLQYHNFVINNARNYHFLHLETEFFMMINKARDLNNSYANLISSVNTSLKKYYIFSSCLGAVFGGIVSWVGISKIPSLMKLGLRYMGMKSFYAAAFFSGMVFFSGLFFLITKTIFNYLISKTKKEISTVKDVIYLLTNMNVEHFAMLNVKNREWEDNYENMRKMFINSLTENGHLKTKKGENIYKRNERIEKEFSTRRFIEFRNKFITNHIDKKKVNHFDQRDESRTVSDKFRQNGEINTNNSHVINFMKPNDVKNFGGDNVYADLENYIKMLTNDNVRWLIYLFPCHPEISSPSSPSSKWIEKIEKLGKNLFNRKNSKGR